jgi:hypothetical protein
VDAEVLEARLGSQPDLRYLCANRFPDALTIRTFLELHSDLVGTVLKGCLIGVETEGTDSSSHSIQSEVDRRLTLATEARLPLAA